MLQIFAITLTGRVVTSSRVWWVGADRKWSDVSWLLDSDFISGTEVAAISRTSGHIDLFAVGKDRKVWSAAKGPNKEDTWVGWFQILDGTLLPGTPISAVSRSEGHVDLFAIGRDGCIWTAAWGPHTDGWKGWNKISTEVFAQGSTIAATARSANNIDLFLGGFDGNIWSVAWNGGEWKQFTI